MPNFRNYLQDLRVWFSFQNGGSSRPPKLRERNLLAALLSISSVAMMSIALAEPRWFHYYGGSCNAPSDTLSLLMFYGAGTWEVEGKSASADEHYTYTTHQNQKLVDCVTPQIVLLIRLVSTFSFLAVIMSLVAFFLETFGTKHRLSKMLLHNAILNIMTVIMCMLSDGFCYWASDLMHEMISDHLKYPGSVAEVRFDVGYYLVAAAGAAAVFAAACNLMRPLPATPRDPDEPVNPTGRGRLVSDANDVFSDEIDVGDGFVRLTAPPPYTPYTAP